MFSECLSELYLRKLQDILTYILLVIYKIVLKYKEHVKHIRIKVTHVFSYSSLIIKTSHKHSLVVKLPFLAIKLFS